MPNWADTTYTLTGKDARKVFNIIEKHFRDKSDYNHNWLGHVVEDLNESKCDLYARGWVNDWEIENDENIILYCQTAWSELNEWRTFVESKFDDLKIYYVTDECGLDVHITNNPNFEYKFLVDNNECCEDLYKTEEEMLAGVCNFIGKDTVGTRKEVEEWCEQFNSENEDKYIYIHEYEYVED